jgi:hypothetical protein
LFDGFVLCGSAAQNKPTSNIIRIDIKGQCMKKKIIIGISAVLGVALLAGAAFMAARLFGAAQPDQAGAPGSGSASTKFKLTPAPEVPQTDPDLAGQVTEIRDNSIFVTTLPARNRPDSADVIGKDAAVGGQSATPSGPVTEVVVSKDTLIYRDTTKDNIPMNASGSSVTILKQIVEPIDVSQIARDFRIQVWGERRGDRMIAKKIIVAGARVIQPDIGGNEPPTK